MSEKLAAIEVFFNAIMRVLVILYFFYSGNNVNPSRASL